MRVETGFRSESESEPSRLNESQLACCTAHREVSSGKGATSRTCRCADVAGAVLSLKQDPRSAIVDAMRLDLSVEYYAACPVGLLTPKTLGAT